MSTERKEQDAVPVEPFTIEPNTIYPIAWLRERLNGIVTLDTLLDRLELRDKRVFRDAVLGREIIESMGKAKPYAMREEVPTGVSPHATAHRQSRKASTCGIL